MENDLADPLTRRIIGCAIEVHRRLGAGLLEKLYLRALAIELGHQSIAFEREPPIEVTYRDEKLGTFYPDFIVEGEVIVEVKSASAHDRVFDAQVLGYMRLTGRKKGLLLNFGRPVLREGIKRFVL